ncbi:MAG: CatB-related O-acetyltransferase [Microcystis aeruginosa Ma_AC_P_19900807_S299]|uniref:CatB-related O-acetyltransferase n=1 Tax=Microcystis aeruginosa Ma_SC_T_19800800_S464 TaxID=2486257 RepID=A0A552E3M0_MICAE|nr:MAG: CatB-related O-acetyltransferase [Microcystis aeruginosa Ma_AC_P_19900807_S299]TRU29043.1 MAG: CatB-related O-acetyltransferase [Microcystis aeruginosa Ma_SC_T_19800800_S464]
MKTLSKILVPDYFRFLSNFFENKIKYKNKNFYQGHMSIVRETEIGANVKIYPYAKVINSKIDSYTYIGTNTKVNRANLGKFCSIGPDCKIGLGKHPSSGNYVSSNPIFYSTLNQLEITFSDQNYFDELGNITIGNDVWIGTNVIIRDDVNIGDGVIIAAASVVTKDIPSYAVYAGVPAKLIRYRFNEELIDFLLQIKWWNKDESWLRENFKSFHNITDFICKIKN